MSKWMNEREAAHYAHILFPLDGGADNERSLLAESEAEDGRFAISSDDLRGQFAELQRWLQGRGLSGQMTDGRSVLQHTPELLGEAFFEIVMPDEAKGGIWRRRPTGRGDGYPR